MINIICGNCTRICHEYDKVECQYQLSIAYRMGRIDESISDIEHENEIFNAGYKEGRKDHIKELDQENDIQRWRKSGHP